MRRRRRPVKLEREWSVFNREEREKERVPCENYFGPLDGVGPVCLWTAEIRDQI